MLSAPTTSPSSRNTSIRVSLLYTLAAAAAGSQPDAWARVNDYSRALPVDWLTAGSGGAVLGYWISERLHEMKYIERHQEQSEGA